MLDKRLNSVLSLVQPCNIFADIGCDHGKLALAVVKSGRAKFARLSDISEKSLDKARALFAQNGIKTAKFFCGDGLGAIDTRPDVAVIAGMGGQEIRSILQSSPFKCDTYILQPMKNSDMLRAYLASGGYEIIYDRCVYETKRFYDIIKAKYTGKSYKLGRLEKMFGKTNLTDMHKDFIENLQYRINSCEGILSGAISGGRRQQIAEELALLKQVLTGGKV